MNSPLCHSRAARSAGRRTVRVLDKDYKDLPYKPQFALGILCLDEEEQIKLHRKLRRLLPGKEVKVLAI